MTRPAGHKRNGKGHAILPCTIERDAQAAIAEGTTACRTSIGLESPRSRLILMVATAVESP